MPSKFPDSVRSVAAYASQRMGGEQRAVNYYDDTEETVVGILECRSTPVDDQMTATTVSLHLAPNRLAGADIRVELMMHTTEATGVASSVVSSGALNVIKDGWLAAPGVVYPNLIADYYPRTSVPHVMWTEPRVWSDMSSIVMDGLNDVHWLMAFPISDPERRLLLDRGYDELDRRLEGTAFWNLDRASVV